MSIERRRAPRYQLITDAEVLELRTNNRLKAKTSDVSLVGCFMNTAWSLPTGTEIQVELRRQEGIFKSKGVVARAQPMGMGVSFSNIKKDQQEILTTWLADLRRPAATAGSGTSV
jgi:hypothetical protein